MATQDAVELARMVLRYGSPLNDAEIDWLANDTVRTRVVRLTRPVPIEVRYDLVEASR